MIEFLISIREINAILGSTIDRFVRHDIHMMRVTKRTLIQFQPLI